MAATCRSCFHYNVCGLADDHTDVSMCKQFITHNDVLCGSALRVVLDDYEKLKMDVKRLTSKNSIRERKIEELERELTLLRIIKQTMEMTSGMTFDI